MRELRRSPDEHKDAENEPGQPCLEDRTGGVRVPLADFAGNILEHGVQDAFRLPDFQEDDQRDNGQHRRKDIHQPGSVNSGDDPLRHRKRSARH